jgi:ribosomal protein S18 acetylase RimI-like enzyme
VAVLLKNLLARTPKTEDLEAIKELVMACDIAEHGLVGSTMEDLIVNWQEFDFNLTSDAWIIVTIKGQIVGFACVWHRDYEQISTFVCVHPEYRARGIGTLMLRLAEERARQHIPRARPGARVTLSGTVSSINEQAKLLFKREGYTPIRQFWRVGVSLDESVDRSSRHANRKIELDVVSQRLIGAAPLYDRDALYLVREYYVYEKELRAGERLCVSTDDAHDVLMVAG